MVFEKLFGRLKTKQEDMPPEEEIVEIDPAKLSDQNKINVKVEILRDFSDTEKVQQLLREGSVVFLKIREMREKDISELKRSVDRIRKTCMAMNGDMVGVDEDFLIVCPAFARVYRGKVA